MKRKHGIFFSILIAGLSFFLFLTVLWLAPEHGFQNGKLTSGSDPSTYLSTGSFSAFGKWYSAGLRSWPSSST